MHIILGGTGNVGSAVAENLLAAGEAVTIVTRDAYRAGPQSAKRHVAQVDIRDVTALRTVFRTGRRLFLLNPPASPESDTDVEERASIAAILAALDGCDLEKIVLASTYGAQKGNRIGDLGTLYTLEQALACQSIPFSVNRGAYYMSNWAMGLETAASDGVVPSFFPADFELPMVAPMDLGAAGARRLMAPVTETGIHHVEGPRRYTPADVADAFGKALGKPVRVEAVPREAVEDAFRAFGFSEAAAASYAGMTAATLDGEFPPLAQVERGIVTLERYIGELVASAH